MAEPIGNTFKGITQNGTVQNLRCVNNLLVNANSLSQLDDVNTTGVATGNALIYNSSTTKWEPRNLLFNGDLADVVITNPQDNDKLIYDSSNSRWINSQPYYFNYNYYGKFKDSYINNIAPETYINLLVNDPNVFDSFTLTGSSSYGLSLNGNFITGFRGTAQYQVVINTNFSILTIDDGTSFESSLRDSLNNNIILTSITNSLNNPNRPLTFNSITSISAANIYPAFRINAFAPHNYSGQPITDISVSITIYEL